MNITGMYLRTAELYVSRAVDMNKEDKNNFTTFSMASCFANAVFFQMFT